MIGTRILLTVQVKVSGSSICSLIHTLKPVDAVLTGVRKSNQLIRHTQLLGEVLQGRSPGLYALEARVGGAGLLARRNDVEGRHQRA